MSKECAALDQVDKEFRSLVRRVSEADVNALPISSDDFVSAVRKLEEMIAARERDHPESAVSVEELKRDVERKKLLLEKHKGDLARWKLELQAAVSDAEKVLNNEKNV